MRRMIHRAIATICRWLERCELLSLLRAEEIQQDVSVAVKTRR